MRVNLVRLLAILLFIAGASGLPDARPAAAGNNVWTSSGPFGGDVKALVIDRATPSTLYAGTAVGIYKSTNNGGSWTAFSGGLATPSERNVTALAIDRNNGAIYAGTNLKGVFKSTNGGTSWTAVNNGLANLQVRSIATFDSTANNPIYVGTESGVFRSTNDGASWVGVNTGITVPLIRVVKFSPNDPNTLYAGTDAGMFKTIDGATSWDPINTGLGTPIVKDLDFAGNSGSKIFAATTDGMFLTASAGASWSAVNTGLPVTNDLTRVVTDPSDAATAYAGVADTAADTGGLFKTTNAGAGWAPVQTGLPTNPGPLALAVHPTTPETIYAGLEALGVFKTTNGGGSWNDVNVGLNATSISSLARHPTNASILYAASTSSGIFKSIDAGATWTLVNNNLPRRGAQDVVVGPANGNHIFVRLTKDRIFRSTDAGASWTEASAGLPGSISSSGFLRSLAIHPDSGDLLSETTLFAGASSNQQGAFKSTDGGTTWNPSNGGIETSLVRDFAIHPSAPNTVFAAASGNEVVKSTDGGATWSPSDTGLTGGGSQTLAIQPNNASIMYVGLLNQRVAKSTDGGATWAASAAGLPNAVVEDVVVHPTRPNIVYAAMSGFDIPPTDGGFAKSIDAGATWSPLENGLDIRQVRAVLAVASSNNTRIYAGTEGRGVFSIDQAVFTLTVTRAGAGSGTVASSPAGISCGGDCSENYEVGTVVTLTATPASNSLFAGWSGACTNATGTCQVTIDAAKSVTATFVQAFTLTVSRQGTGSGTVTSNPAGINCGTDCTEVYASGTVVTLTASPSGGSVFAGWSGSGCSGTGTCQVTMSQARSVTATFSTAPPPPTRKFPTVDFNGDGRTDPAITQLGTGPNGQALWFAPGAGFTVPFPNTTGDVLAPADYDGDGKTDVLFFRPNANVGGSGAGLWFGQRSGNGALIQVPFAQPGDVPIPCDYDGDGKDDVAIFRPSQGLWFGLDALTGANVLDSRTIHGPFGEPNDVPVVGDYDGDGRCDIAIFRASQGLWYGFRATSQTKVLDSTTTTGPLGQTGDIAVPADYDGNGTTDLAFFRPSSGLWFGLTTTNAVALPAVTHGQNLDIPLPGYYDADAKADVAFFRPSTGQLVYKPSTGGANVTTTFAPNDLPVGKRPAADADDYPY